MQSSAEPELPAKCTPLLHRPRGCCQPPTMHDLSCATLPLVSHRGLGFMLPSWARSTVRLSTPGICDDNSNIQTPRNCAHIEPPAPRTPPAACCRRREEYLDPSSYTSSYDPWLSIAPGALRIHIAATYSDRQITGSAAARFTLEASSLVPRTAYDVHFSDSPLCTIVDAASIWVPGI